MRKFVDILMEFLKDCITIPTPDVFLMESPVSLSQIAIYSLEEKEFNEREKIVKLMLKVMLLFKLLRDEKINRLKINSDEQKEKLLLNIETHRSEYNALCQEATKCKSALFTAEQSAKEGWDVVPAAVPKDEGWDSVEDASSSSFELT